MEMQGALAIFAVNMKRLIKLIDKNNKNTPTLKWKCHCKILYIIL